MSGVRAAIASHVRGRGGVVLAAVVVAAALVWWYRPEGAASLDDAAPIKVGVLHSLTGTMGASEKMVVAACELAIEEINAAGGLLGRRVVAVVRDGRSDWPTFAREAERLIASDKITTIFGCWTSASRKSVRPVFEKHGALLFYPVQYEGLETSPNIVYMGAAPNQQIIPAIHWCLGTLGRKVYLVGSDYVFPRTANAIVRAQVEALGGEVVGERYVLVGSDDVAEVVADIARVKPSVIVHTIVGSSNTAFFTALRGAGVTPSVTPTLTFTIAEPELAQLGAAMVAGDYAAWNYFQCLPGDANAAFVAGIRRRLGPTATTSDPMEAAYVGVMLWAKAVAQCGSTDVARVREALFEQTAKAPEGVVVVDRGNQHAWKTARIGRITGDGQFQVVWDSLTPVRPEPYPMFRSRQGWDAYLDAMFRGWGGRWANPGVGR